MKITGIYKITSVSKKIYIGQAKDIYLRWKHYKQLHCKVQPAIYRSLLKYGIENHIFEIVEECEFENLNIRERYWQDYYNVLGPNGLNCVLQETNVLKRVVSQSTKNKLSFKGRLRIDSEETKKKKKEARKGIIFTREHKENIKISKLGLKLKKDHILNIIENNGKSKIVLNIENGIFYSSCRQAALIYNISSSYLSKMLNGNIINKTNLRYA